jgi:hypothetical protein
MLTGKFVVSGCFGAILGVLAGPALAQNSQGGGGGGCNAIPNLGKLKSALSSSITAASGPNGGLGNNMWGTIVDTGGTVCAVAFSGANFTSQWLGSRVISAQKANTANAFSLSNTPAGSLFAGKGLALSTANLFTAVQPGGSLYGLQHSNPVETEVAYGNSAGGQGNAPANASSFGTPSDPMVGQRIGGVNVFGGGLALYSNGVKVGGLGVSGDTSCTDHMVAWRTRSTLGLDGFGKGVTGVSGDPARPDNIIFDINPNTDGTGATGQSPTGDGGVGQSNGGFGHPKCLNSPDPSILPAVH